MNERLRTYIMRANALYLGLSAVNGLFMDIAGIFFSRGPAKVLYENAPYSGLGFIEAHGLALILSIIFWQAPSTRFWHTTAAAVLGLLGTANLVFWDIFSVAGSTAMGYFFTSLHFIFATLQAVAAVRWSREQKTLAAKTT